MSAIAFSPNPSLDFESSILFPLFEVSLNLWSYAKISHPKDFLSQEQFGLKNPSSQVNNPMPMFDGADIQF